MSASLRILPSKADSNTWESFTRSELKLESVYQESLRSDVFRKRATMPLLKQKQRQQHPTWAKEKKTGLLLSGPKTSFQIKVNFAFHLEIEVWGLEEDWRGSDSMLLEVQCEVSEVRDDLGHRNVCWFRSIKSKVNETIYQEIFQVLYASIC